MAQNLVQDDEVSAAAKPVDGQAMTKLVRVPAEIPLRELPGALPRGEAMGTHPVCHAAEPGCCGCVVKCGDLGSVPLAGLKGLLARADHLIFVSNAFTSV